MRSYPKGLNGSVVKWEKHSSERQEKGSVAQRCQANAVCCWASYPASLGFGVFTSQVKLFYWMMVIVHSLTKAICHIQGHSINYLIFPQTTPFH